MDDWQDDISDLLEDEIYDPKPESTPSNLTRINWIGIPTGILMIILPFLGGWWQFTIGDEAIITTLSISKIEDSKSKVGIILENIENFEQLVEKGEIDIGADLQSLWIQLRKIRKLLILELKS